MNVGYARVSTSGQTLESQFDELGNSGCAKIYSETASGAWISRPQLQSLLKALDPGDVVVVTRLDRLARSTIDLLTTIKQIADNRCLFKSLADPWCDTTTPGGRLMLTVLGGLAEFERELIKARTSEGRERAKRAGIRMGRKPKLSPHQIAEVRERKAGGESVRFLARSYGVSPNTISRVR
jgi:DNA invertase Pin-like site-specific DNA recombinase